MTSVLPPTMTWDRTPAEITASLPHDAYEVARQPHIADEIALIKALDVVQHIAPVATRESILETRVQLADIACNHNRVVVIQGNCNERVAQSSPNHITQAMLIRREIVNDSAVGSNALLIERGLGQNTKPRTKAGGYCGDMINDPDDLMPDPVRIIVAAAQARDVQRQLEKRDERAISAHEALLLPYELSRIAVDMKAGKRFLLSADVPWIGDRTSDPDGVHVEILRNIQNVVGIKVGDSTTPERVAAWARKLNPDHAAGKLLFMMRMSDNNIDAMRDIIRAIMRHAPQSIILYDIHAATEDIGGQKIRAVSKIINQIRLLADTCAACGTSLDGVHLETETMNDDQMQCVDEPSQQPSQEWSVDPQLSPRQLKHILDVCEPCFGRQKVIA